MDANEAAALVSGLAFYPGWKIEAEPAPDRFEATIRVRFYIGGSGGVNSDRPHAPDYGERVEPNGPRAAFYVHVGDCSHDEVIGRVIDAAVDNFTHELREFVRYQVAPGEWHAPFHPHRHSTILAWSARTGRDPYRDYSFGLA